MHVKVYKQGALPEAQWEGDVPSMSLGEVFRFFNLVTEEDCMRLAEIGYRHPSLSVDDIVLVEGFAYECMPIGWERRPELDATEQEVV